jgi:hypothetical protein
MKAKQQLYGLCLVVLLLINLINPSLEAAGRGGGFSGGSRSSFSAPATARPANTFSAPAPRSSGFGSTSFRGYDYRRRGSLTSPILIGLAAGLLTSSALNSLNRNPNAYCNGVSIQCYKNACQQALTQCQAANNTTLNLIPCPDNRFTECYSTNDTSFECFGTRRPSFGNDDVQGFCNRPGSSSAGGLKLQLALMGVLLMAAVLLM